MPAPKLTPTQEARVAAGRCACGCGEAPLEGSAYAGGSAHRQRARRERVAEAGGKAAHRRQEARHTVEQLRADLAAVERQLAALDRQRLQIRARIREAECDAAGQLRVPGSERRRIVRQPPADEDAAIPRLRCAAELLLALRVGRVCGEDLRLRPRIGDRQVRQMVADRVVLEDLVALGLCRRDSRAGGYVLDGTQGLPVVAFVAKATGRETPTVEDLRAHLADLAALWGTPPLTVVDAAPAA